MSFYHGGIRFRSSGRRASDTQVPTQQEQEKQRIQQQQHENHHPELQQPQRSLQERQYPTQQAASSLDFRDHPLRQNGILGRPASLRQPMPSQVPMNPKSYAARAQARPDLNLDASPTLPASYSQASPFSEEDLYSPQERPRTSETQRARKGSVPDRSPLQKLEVTLGDISKEEKRARVEEAEQIARRNSETNGAVPSVDSRVDIHRPNGDRGVTRKPLPTNSHVAQRSNGFHGSDQGKPVRKSSVRQGGVLFPHQHTIPSRDRRYGHDATLTGGAAAAAVGVYQPTKLFRDDRLSPLSDSSSGFHEDAGGPSQKFQKRSQAYPDPEDRNIGGMPGTRLRDSHTLQPTGDQQGSQRNVPHQHLDHDLGQTAPGKGHLRFSGLVHRDRPPDRKYQPCKPLDEWRNAPTASLIAEDLDLDSQQSQTWWERSANHKSKGQRRPSPGTPSINEYLDGGIPQTRFQPPLLLKCGPLLRYKGIQRDSSDGAVASDTRHFWRGSVMIVTEDATSSNEAPPTLRLFKQPMELVRSKANQASNEVTSQQYSVDHNDLVAGLPKCAPTGQTVFTKHLKHLEEGVDLSLQEGEAGLFESSVSTQTFQTYLSRLGNRDGERIGRYREVKGHRLHVERGVTFWRFNIEVELGSEEERVAYRINKGPAIGFWVPAKNQGMNIMFHSCNGFSSKVDSNTFSGPDPLWRDVLGAHQKRPFHVMIGGGDQVYNDEVVNKAQSFGEWLSLKNPMEKHHADFTEEMQDELEHFYMTRYAMWFSQGLFGLANSQIAMVNIWDDHDIIDGFGSYPDDFMSTSVFSGLGAVAFKYYMLFQHQSLIEETQDTEPSWVLGSIRGPYIHELSRSVLMSLGNEVAFLGLDCRTERMRHDILSQQTYDIVFDRLRREIPQDKIKHLVVLLGVPIAYPRLEFLENLLTSRVMDPFKALGRAGMLSGFVNKFDGGVEVLDDLDDHWTAKRHKIERNWFIQELQEFAAEQSVRVTILSGDVHLAAVGQFYSNKKFGIPKDRDHRYMPNIVSSAIVNTPPPGFMADVINKRNRVHHLDDNTDENMIPLFTSDVDGRRRNNVHLLPRRNWCAIRPFSGEDTPPPSPTLVDLSPPKRRRSFSLTRRSSSDGSSTGRGSFLRRFSSRAAPPSSFRGPMEFDNKQQPYSSSGLDPRADDPLQRRWSSNDDRIGMQTAQHDLDAGERPGPAPAASFQRRPSNMSSEGSWAQDVSGRQGNIDLEGGLEFTINCEVNQRDPSGETVPYKMIVPALFYEGRQSYNPTLQRGRVSSFIGSIRRGRSRKSASATQGMPYESNQLQPTPPMGKEPWRSPSQTRDLSDDEGELGDMQAGANQASGRNRVSAPYPTNPSQHHHVPDGRNDEYGTSVAHAQSGENFQSTLDHLPRSDIPLETEVPYRSNSVRRRASHEQQRSNSLKDTDMPPPIHTLHRKLSKDRRSPHAEAHRSEPLPGPRKRQHPQLAKPIFRNDDPDIPPVPSIGLDAPLGRVGNRISSQPTNVPWNAADAPWSQKQEAQQEKRSVSSPAAIDKPSRPSAAAEQAQRDLQRDLPPTYAKNEEYIMAGRKGAEEGRRSSATKDPYAHLYPEAVEAGWNSDEEEGDVSPVQSDGEEYDSMGDAEFAQHHGHGHGYASYPLPTQEAMQPPQQHPQQYSHPRQATTGLEDFDSLPSNDSLALNVPAHQSNNRSRSGPVPPQQQQQQKRYYAKPSPLSQYHTPQQHHPSQESQDNSPVSPATPPPPKSSRRQVTSNPAHDPIHGPNKLAKHYANNIGSRHASSQPPSKRNSLGFSGTDETGFDLDTPPSAIGGEMETIGMPSAHARPVGEAGVSEKAARRLGVAVGPGAGVPVGGRDGIHAGFGDDYVGASKRNSGGFGGFVRRLSGGGGGGVGGENGGADGRKSWKKIF